MAIQDELPESRITLKYRTTINGEEEDIKLPMRTMVIGDFSAGTSKDREEDLETRRMRTFDGTNRVDDVMKDMGITLNLQVDNKIDPGADTIDVSLPLTGMKSFTPAEVAKAIPQVKALLELKAMLRDFQSNIDNRRDLRKLVQELWANPAAMKQALAELKGYEGFKLPSADEERPGDGTSAGSDGEGQG